MVKSTNDAFRAQDAALLIKIAKDIAKEVEVRADGRAARAAVCALAVCNGVKSAKLDKKAIEINTDEEYLDKFFIPGICVLGGMEDCVKLVGCNIEKF